MSVTEHPAFIAPENAEIKIWRYMDFTKFVYMLEQAGLFFPRLDRLGDSFEGSSTYAEVTSRENWWVGVGPPRQVLGAQKMVSQFQKWQRQWTYVSCWHMNELESAAMWKLYARNEEAICVQSTYKLLLDCLNRHTSGANEQMFIGQVDYVDFKDDTKPAADNLLNVVMHKRKSFAHERELRAVVQRRPNSENGPVRLTGRSSRRGFS